MTNKIRIEPLSAQWIQDVAKIHFDSLPEDFLPRLGLDFLVNTFYPAVLSSNLGEVFIAIDSFDKPDGFVLVTSRSNDFLGSLLTSRFLDFLLVGICNSFKSPTT